MSVNIYDGTNLTPIAGKTVPAPTPDYVDEQFNPSTTYSKGMTCIVGNVRYRYKNSTATSGHRPPDTTYWEVLSVADEIHNGTKKTLLKEKTLTTNGSTPVTNDDQSANIDLRGYDKVQFLVGIKRSASSSTPHYIIYSDEFYLNDIIMDNYVQQISSWCPAEKNISLAILTSGASGAIQNYFTRMQTSAVWGTASGVVITFRVYGIKF